MRRWTPGVHPETHWCSILQFWCLKHLPFLFTTEDLRVQQSGFILVSLSSTFCLGKCLWRDSGIVMQFSASQSACHCWCCIVFQKTKVKCRHMDHRQARGWGSFMRWPHRLTQTALSLLMRPCVVYRYPDSTKPSSWGQKQMFSYLVVQSSCSFMSCCQCWGTSNTSNVSYIIRLLYTSNQ